MFQFLYDFKEAMCPSSKLKDVKEKLQNGFNKALEVKDQQIGDLQKEIEQLKKQRICCFCPNKEDLTVFTPALWEYTGYSSYFYCNNEDCIKHYIDEIEGLLPSSTIKY